MSGHIELVGNEFINRTLAAEGIEVVGPVDEKYAQILTLDALRFLAKLERTFGNTRRELLGNRKARQAELDEGVRLDFLESTAHVRSGDWKAAKPSQGLVDRRIEITGPVDRKMMINALNSGATQFMADFEDATCPTWDNIMNGLLNARDAIARTITFLNPNGKVYKLNDKVATLLIRPRGWHLEEKHVLIDGKPMSGSIFDFGLYFYHNAFRSIMAGQGPYFYLPKMESHLEARLWNDIFNMAQDHIHMPRGTIRATCLIETINAAFEMDEIIYELRDHSSGLNCGRWDYIFSFIKCHKKYPDFILPDRKDVTMTTPFMNAYVELLIKTCHKRGVHAMGGMAAQIPIKNDAQANEKALAKVHADKLREVLAGHDGTWVAHPGLIPIAKKIFDEHMPGPNQLDKMRDDVNISAKDLLSNSYSGSITESGVRENVSVSLQYMDAWLRGQGCVPINNLMEDAATAEISRSQLWQWIRYQSKMTDKNEVVTQQLVYRTIDEEVAKLKAKAASPCKYQEAADILKSMVISKEQEFPDFITTECYDAVIGSAA
eukprot:Nk52_evm7s167 gene=Nk52_evmTU7s167